MSGDLSELYQQVILDHNKRPRNRGKLPTANRVAHGDNPSCGDQCSVYLRLDGERIGDISFDGSGCADQEQRITGELLAHVAVTTEESEREGSRAWLVRGSAVSGVAAMPDVGPK